MGGCASTYRSFLHKKGLFANERRTRPAEMRRQSAMGAGCQDGEAWDARGLPLTSKPLGVRNGESQGGCRRGREGVTKGSEGGARGERVGEKTKGSVPSKNRTLIYLKLVSFLVSWKPLYQHHRKSKTKTSTVTFLFSGLRRGRCEGRAPRRGGWVEVANAP